MVDALLRHGSLIVFGWVFVAQAGVPLPIVPLLLAVGALGRLGKLGLEGALLAALGGSVLADVLWYGVGRRWGGEVVPGGNISHARKLFLAHRLRALVIGKFFFGINPLIAALAGNSGIGAGEFLLYDVASAALWVSTWVGIGYFIQDGMKEVTVPLASWGVWVIVEIAGALAAYGVVKYANRREIRERGARMSARPSESRP